MDRERRIVTTMFCDLVGFTPLSERFDPEDIQIIQDSYFKTAQESIERHNGIVAKFIGDAVMAVFGAIQSRDDDAENAVRTALSVIGAIEEVGSSLGLEPKELQLRVGITSGEVAVRPDAETAEGIVSGDLVNIAARLQSAAPPGGVYVDAATMLATAGAVLFEPAGELELKGKSRPVRAWRAISVDSSLSREDAMGALRAPILGRDLELGILTDFVSSSNAYTRRMVVAAPPGVGKSRLLTEFARRLPAHARAVRTRCLPAMLTPFEPLVRLLEDALSGAGLEAAHDSASVLSILRQRLDTSGVSEISAEAAVDAVGILFNSDHGTPDDREHVFASWLVAFDAVAQGSKHVWIIEDVHWASEDLLAFLDAASESASAHGRALICSARPSFLETHALWCEQDLMHLPTLPEASARELIQALLGDALPGTLVGAIAERSDGNALFIEELLRAWVSNGTLEQADGRWRLSRAADEVPLPTTVQAIYTAQIDDLPPVVQQAVRRAAVAGRQFPVAALAAVGVVDGERAIEVLLRRALISGPEHDRVLGSSYTFRHALLRDAGYATLARSDRAQIHIQMSQWLEEAGAGREDDVAEMIAGHYASALEATPTLAAEVASGLSRNEASGSAAVWFERAAEGAFERAASDSAARLLLRAMEFTVDENVADRARRMCRYGEIVAFTAHMDKGGRALEESIELYRSLFKNSAGEDRARARHGLVRATASLGKVRGQQILFQSAVTLAEEALHEIGQQDDAETAALLLLKSRSQAMTETTEESIADAHRALEIALRIADPTLELEALEVLADSRDPDTYQRIERLARGQGRWRSVAGALRVQATILIDEHAADAARLIEEAADVAELHGLTEDQAWSWYLETEAGLVSGHWDRTASMGLRAIELGDRNAYHRVVVRTWHCLFPVASARGDIELLERAHRWYQLREGGFPDSPYARIVGPAAYSHLARAGLRPPPAYDIESMLPSFEGPHAGPSWVAATETVLNDWLESGRADAVRLALQRAEDGLDSSSLLWRGAHALLSAEIEPDPVPFVRRALEHFRICLAPWWIAKAIDALMRRHSATPQLLDERRKIHARLGIVSSP